MNMRFNPASGDRSLALRLAMVSASSVSVQRDQPYVVKGWFLAGQISMIVGPSNVGKSFLALDIAHHIARGKDWHGRRVRGAEVLYIAAEGGRTFQNRVAALNQAAERVGDDLSELRLWLLASPVTLTGAESDAAALVGAVKAVQRDYGGRDFRLIVVDTMSRAMGAADENAAKDISDLMCNLETLRDATGAHILLVHHSGKDASKGARGHSSLRAAVDTEIIISRDSETDLIAAKIDKQRDGLTGATFRYRLQVEDLGEDADGDRVTSCVCQPIGSRAQEAGQGSGPVGPVAEVSFSEVPPLGTVVPCGVGNLTLKSVSSNAPGYKLYWIDQRGGRYQSGLCGPVVPYVKPPRRPGV